jgi:hypothetical protein
VIIDKGRPDVGADGTDRKQERRKDHEEFAH